MGSSFDLSNVAINQPTLSLFLGLFALGISEYFNLPYLFWFALIFSSCMGILVILYIINLVCRYFKK